MVVLWWQHGNEHIKKHPEQNTLQLQASLGNGKILFRYVSDVGKKQQKTNKMFCYPLLPPYLLCPLLHHVQHQELQKQSA